MKRVIVTLLATAFAAAPALAQDSATPAPAGGQAEGGTAEQADKPASGPADQGTTTTTTTSTDSNADTPVEPESNQTGPEGESDAADKPDPQ
ncbi:hypothetical protein [Sphingosinicella sp. CPCC 101087]|uniref:hypothetical protein n=1 Tax=Sphingosinicella sp. CPCC 101087 TaxID=2497754 RepID=UPI00101C402A|nr:hypothetical protein [Sphingosinicella sp. CPCC 101087]